MTAAKRNDAPTSLGAMLDPLRSEDAFASASDDVVAWIAEEQPSPENVQQLTRLLEASFSTTTKLLLALVAFYQSVDCGPETQADNDAAAGLLRRFAHEFAAHERRTL